MANRPEPAPAMPGSPPVPATPTGSPALTVEVTRGDRVESRHRGSIAVVNADGARVAHLGDPEEPTFLRSSAKPFQLAPFVASGRFDAYNFPDPVQTLDVMAASHAGEDRHVRLVQGALRAGGLSRSALQCGTHTPFDAETAQRLARDGEPPNELRHNCSGKHAAMALHAKAAGWDVDTYWQPDHPIQQLALETVAAVSGVPARRIGTATDGCGVVSFAIPLHAIARAYARLADPTGLTDATLRDALTRIRDAMLAHPDLVSGERRQFDTDLMRAAPGRLVAKGGAEGLRCVGLLPGGIGADAPAAGVAVKIEDGDAARRAGAAATCETLRQIGFLGEVELSQLAAYAAPPIRDLPRGEVVGEVRAAFTLAR
ncbi:MAG: asparaginase [Chloroflexota bacterium]|nr:asparaginase [Chloroflexota bacterium]